MQHTLWLFPHASIKKSWQILVEGNVLQEVSSQCEIVIFGFSPNFAPSLEYWVSVLCKVLFLSMKLFERNLAVSQSTWKKELLGDFLEVQQLYDYEKHYMAKRTTSCNWLGVLALTSARCRNVFLSVNVMANTLTAWSMRLAPCGIKRL